MRRRSGGSRAPIGPVGYLFATLGILTSLLLGIATLAVGVRAEANPDLTQPSVAIEETNPGDTGADGPQTPNTPGYDPKQANLVTAEDKRVFASVGQVLPGTAPKEVSSPGALPTVVLPSRSSAYTLDTLSSLGAVVKQQDNGLLMVKNVLVAPGARLQIAWPNGQLRLSSSPAGIASLITFKGTLDLSGADRAPLTIIGWDPKANAPDTDETDGRAYVRDIGGRMDLNWVTATDLGFWSGRTGGVAWTGSAAVPSTGTATGLTLTGNHYGAFLSRSNGVLINGAQVSKSVMDGIAVHTGAVGTQLWKITAVGNGRNGIAASTGAQNTSLRDVTATGSARNGIYLDGTPPATGPNAGGGTTQQASGFTVDGSTARGNSEHGILVNNANNVQLTNNTVASNRDGIIVRGVTHGVVLRANHVSSPGGFAVAIRGGAKDAVVMNNQLSDALTAVQVNDSVASISGNEITGVGVHGVALIGRSSGSSVKDNKLDGRGPSAVDTNRLAFGGVVTESGNDTSTWTVDRNDVQFLTSFVRNHPLVMLWFLTLILPLAARMLYRNRSKRVIGAHPYAHKGEAWASQPARPALSAPTPSAPIPPGPVHPSPPQPKLAGPPVRPDVAPRPTSARAVPAPVARPGSTAAPAPVRQTPLPQNPVRQTPAPQAPVPPPTGRPTPPVGSPRPQPPGQPPPGHPQPGRPPAGQPQPGHPPAGQPQPGHPPAGQPQPGQPQPGQGRRGPQPGPGGGTRVTVVSPN